MDTISTISRCFTSDMLVQSHDGLLSRDRHLQHSNLQELLSCFTGHVLRTVTDSTAKRRGKWTPEVLGGCSKIGSIRLAKLPHSTAK
jgi:hypothetical protein